MVRRIVTGFQALLYSIRVPSTTWDESKSAMLMRMLMVLKLQSK
jgi:hypothetical protein